MLLRRSSLVAHRSLSLLRLAATAVVLSLLFSVPTAAAPAPVADGSPVAHPDRSETFSRSLNGVWSFKYVAMLDAGADEGFIAPAFDVSKWASIPVPAHWELHGFTEPRYGSDVRKGLGLYRRSFKVDKAWSGRRVFLRFEGVLFGFSAYVNGKPVGEWAGGFNQSTFDITDALSRDGGENILAVRVTTRPKGWEFDTMDCWGLSGIYRDVTLFALPETHIKDYTTRTTLQPDGSARLALAVVASDAGRIGGRLLSSTGEPVGAIDLAVPADGRASTHIDVARPELWSAEYPSLYRLELALKSADGRTTHELSTRVGLRHLTIEDAVLKLNGSAIKLRGVNHHEIWPEGRVSTDENTRRDLTLIRDANINFIRTAHYPPHPRLLELADEMGFYVIDEVPFTYGGQYLNDLAYRENLFSRARATVSRDKNHASVLFWSLGNENRLNDGGTAVAAYVKELDPTRPVMFPTVGDYFAENYRKMSDVAEIFAPHYPHPRRARELAAKLTRPILFTEYAHQRGLSRAAAGLQELWEICYESPRIAGGAIWLFQDQGILRTTDQPGKVAERDMLVWLDENRYYDTRGYVAMDGLVYSDRTPQVDYWLTRAVYSPIQIKADTLVARPGRQTLDLEVENRHDFRPLAGSKLRWSLLRNRAPIDQGVVALSALPRKTDTISIPVGLPDDPGSDVFTIELRCYDQAGRSIHERALHLDTGAFHVAPYAALRDTLPAANTELETTETSITVRRPGYQLRLDRATGRLSLLHADGTVLASSFGPHTGRNPTISDLRQRRERASLIWRGSLIDEATDLRTGARQLPEGVELTVSGNYLRPDKPDESVRGGYRLLVDKVGAITVSYDYKPVNATGEMLEAGFALAVPASQSQFRWLGRGPYASYPGKDRHTDFGLFHLHRDDLYFPGNRRAVEIASLAAPSGAGVLLAGHGMTIDLEKKEGVTILSHVSVVPLEHEATVVGVNVDVSARVPSEAIKSISGSFVLIPHSADWPAPLRAWFGSPTDRVDVLTPFLRSYDQ
jgi:beta-galactosidase